MTTEKYINQYKSTVHNNNLLKVVIAVFMLGIIAEGIVIAYISTSRDVIVIPDIRNRYVIGKSKSNTAYAVTMAKFIANDYENYTTQSAKDQFKGLLAFFNPASYHELQVYFASLVSNIKQYQMSSWFVIDKVEIKGNTIAVIGDKKAYIGNNRVSDKQIAILITYTINNHVFSVQVLKVMPYSKYTKHVR